MPTTQTEPVTLYRLDPTTYDDVMARAIQERSRVVVFADFERSVVLLEGTLCDADENHLSVLVTRENSSDLVFNVLSTLQAEFAVGDVLYRFETEGIDEVPGSNVKLVQLSQSKSATATERRRSQRCRFQNAAEVTVISIGCNAPTPMTGPLLNLSTEGIACRLQETEIESIDRDRPMSISFSLSAQERPFLLNGRIVSLTGASAPGYVVVGLEFETSGQREQRTRLRQALQNTCASEPRP